MGTPPECTNIPHEEVVYWHTPYLALATKGFQVIERFRFHDETLQTKLIAVTTALGIEHWNEDGFLCTRERDSDAVECLRDAVRCSLFPEWHQWRGRGAADAGLYARYREYMAAHGIRYVEVEEDGNRWFLLSRSDDPYSWGVEKFIRP